MMHLIGNIYVVPKTLTCMCNENFLSGIDNILHLSYLKILQFGHGYGVLMF